MAELGSETTPAWSNVELHRSGARHYRRHRNREDWLTFDPDGPPQNLAAPFAVLHNICESRWGPAARARIDRPSAGLEIITYVRSGRMELSDPAGGRRVLRAGEFERGTAPTMEPIVETNPSPTHFAHVLRVSLRIEEPPPRRDPERRQFSEAERKGRMRVVASQDGRNGALRLLQDALLVSALLHPGRHATHEVGAQRATWLQIVHGSVSFGPFVLGKGDGAAVLAGVVSITAREHSEILLIDVPSLL